MRIDSTKGLREFLVGQLESATSGEFDHQRAKAVANFAQQIYNTLNIEVRVAVARAKTEGLEVKAVAFDV